MNVFGQPTRPEPRKVTFTAAFDSDCLTCGGPIFEGDVAGYMPGDDGASCAPCIGDDD